MTGRICPKLIPQLQYQKSATSHARSVIASQVLFQLRSLCTSSRPSPERIIFSGIQPTGIPHLGNYLGALREWVQIQDSPTKNSRYIFSIVDLHALTIPQESANLRQWRRQALAMLLAIGLNPERCTIFFQSTVPAHTELMWILSTVASMGYLSRMTQWKSKLQLPDDANLDHSLAKAKLRLGLFSYPVLQAADILVHRATHVPVGVDQKQHIEFSRYTANSFNHIYGPVFPAPDALISPARRVMSLKDPVRKMSKSDTDPYSRILLTDTREDIRKKIRMALTDSELSITYDPDRRPGVSNLIEILSHVDPDGRSCHEVAASFESVGIKALKDQVATALGDYLEAIRERYFDIMGKDANYFEDIAEKGASKARAHADVTMKSVKSAMGLL